MKRILLLFIVAGFAFSAMAQIKPYLNHHKSAVQSLKPAVQIDGQVVGLQTPNTTVASDAMLEDVAIMMTLYDLQSNAAMQQRFYRYDDGAMAGIATFSHDNTYTTRGTGYNYYDGTAWGPQPTAGIEANRTGWPAYAPLGPNGEIVVAHSSATTPLYINRRDTRGTGDWTQTELFGPVDAAGLLWCRMVTNGTDHMNVHIFALTSPTGNGGTVWNDMDGALIYNRSLDGGDTWDGWVQMDGMTSAEYLKFGGDAYAWAQPRGETLAFVVGDSFNDQFIMKSTDNGDTWTKTIIWDCPYDLWTGVDSTDGHFYSSDGCSAAAIGPDGKVHVLFGLQYSFGDIGGATYWTINMDGLIYWNEDMPELPQDLNPDTLDAHGNYIGWVQDTSIFNEDISHYAFYYNSMSSMPALVVDDYDQVFAFWSSMTENEDPYGFFFRHIYARASVDGGATWRDTIVDVTGDVIQQWTEFVFTSVANQTTDMIYLIDQDDDLAGNYLQSSNSGYQGQMEITNNNITCMEIAKADIIQWGVGVNDKPAETFTVAQNSPNPVTGRSVIHVRLTQPGNLSMTLHNVIGQQVMNLNKGAVHAGSHQFSIDGSGLPAGIYFYTVTVDNQSITKRMIVE